MFGLQSRFLRRRLSGVSSGSARRREHQRRKAEETRAEGERLARERREHRATERRESQRMTLSGVSSGSTRRREHQRRKAEETRAEGERLARERREHRATERRESQRMTLSGVSSGSTRRREHQRRKAVVTRAEGERLAPERREHRATERRESQRMALEQLSSYEPWGRAGGGAPNPVGVRFCNLRAAGIFPEDELKGFSRQEALQRYLSPLRQRRRTQRLREDPQLCYGDALRKSVDNDIRYRRTPHQQTTYKEILDKMVDNRKKSQKEEKKRNAEYERKMQAMDGPWGKPGPGGTAWRNPRNIGLNFNKSMGWTTNEMFDKIKGDHNNLKRSSLTLPKVKRDDDAEGDSSTDKENVKPSNVDKLPDIKHTNSPNNGSRQNSGKEKQKEKEEKEKNEDEEKFKHMKDKPEKDVTGETETNGRPKKSHKKKGTFVKRLPNGQRVKRIVLEDSEGSDEKNVDMKLTPETAILRLTGGIELVPLLARKRRVGARTLPSSDVTRPSDQPCQWREPSLSNADYLRELKRQIEVKYISKEETRKNSAESVRQHHATWASLWGRPGHGAPQLRGRYARTNLAHLLYVAPLAQAP